MQLVIEVRTLMSMLVTIHTKIGTLLRRNPIAILSRGPHMLRGFVLGFGPTDFYNRITEINMLTRLLKSDPQLTVVTGPVNSGKSLIMSKILEDVGKDKTVPVLPLNLRNVSFNFVESLVDTLTAKFTSWMGQIWQAAERLQLDGSVYGLDVKFSIDFGSKMTPMSRLNRLLEMIGNRLPPHSF